MSGSLYLEILCKKFFFFWFRILRRIIWRIPIRYCRKNYSFVFLKQFWFFTRKFKNFYSRVHNISKFTWGEQPVEDIPIFTCKYVGLCICTALFGYSQKIYKHEICYPHSPRTYLKTGFFEEVTLRAASLEKLPCHVDFPHISSITLLRPRPIWLKW